VTRFPEEGMMEAVRAEEARNFCEEDEDPEQVFAIFDAAHKDRTRPPRRLTARRRLAAVLRKAADAIEHKSTKNVA
jgi:hypothetical protein